MATGCLLRESHLEESIPKRMTGRSASLREKWSPVSVWALLADLISADGGRGHSPAGCAAGLCSGLLSASPHRVRALKF